MEEDNSEEERDLVDDALKAEGQDVQDGLKEGVACTSGLFESALTSAFNRTDEEFGKADNAALVGTTAVVALVGSRQLYVANCGMPCQPQNESKYSLCPFHMGINLFKRNPLVLTLLRIHGMTGFLCKCMLAQLADKCPVQHLQNRILRQWRVTQPRMKGKLNRLHL